MWKERWGETCGEKNDVARDEQIDEGAGHVE